MPAKINELCIVCGAKAKYHGPKINDEISYLCPRHYQRYLKKGDPYERTLKDPNEFVIYNDYVEVVLFDKNCEKIARSIISVDKLEEAKKHKWTCTFRRGAISYVTTTVNKVVKKMHQVLFNIPDGMVGDHIDRNPLNNTNDNIRIATQKNNSRNLPVKKNNTSGVSGVFWDKWCKKWRAQIKSDLKMFQLGSYVDKDDAITARLNAEIKYFGDYAPQAYDPRYKKYVS